MQYRRGIVRTERRDARTVAEFTSGGGALSGGGGRFGRAPRRRDSENGAVVGVGAGSSGIGPGVADESRPEAGRRIEEREEPIFWNHFWKGTRETLKFIVLYSTVINSNRAYRTHIYS